LTNAIKAIETTYAGYRFRSRLEARWAVFFDTLGMPWRYEVEGYDLPSGRYLPDFQIQGCLLGDDRQIWVEVKGSLGHDEFIRLCRAASELPSAGREPLSPQILILGDVPRPGKTWSHIRLETSSEYLVSRGVVFEGGAEPRIAPLGEGVPYRHRWFGKMAESETAALRRSFIEAGAEPRLLVDPEVDEAYRAARAARFEYGESG
jgi:hypothetical protein